MTPDQFRAALAGLGLTQAGFARIALVDARTVRRWCGGMRAVPGPVIALLDMLIRCCGCIPLNDPLYPPHSEYPQKKPRPDQ